MKICARIAIFLVAGLMIGMFDLSAQNLGFPIEGLTPSTANLVNSTYDRSLTSAYSKDGIVRAFTLEEGRSGFGDRDDCFMSEDGQPFSLDGTYRGAYGTSFLCYDGHPGVDFKVDGAVIVAPASGEVIGVKNDAPDEPDRNCKCLGNFLKVRTPEGLVWIAGHLKNGSVVRDGVAIAVGDLIEVGEQVAISGNSGASTGAHLHFEVQQQLASGRYKLVDPYDLWTARPTFPNAIVNGSFSEGAADWTLQGDAWAGTEFTAYRTGPGYAALGVDSSGNHLTSATGSISQTFTIPSDANSALMGFWLQISTEEPPSLAADTLTVTIRDPSGSVVRETLAVHSNLDQPAYASYRRRGFDLRNYIGQTVMIHFEGITRGGFATVFRIDDVSVNYGVDPVVSLVSFEQEVAPGNWIEIGESDCSGDLVPDVVLGAALRFRIEGEHLEFAPDMSPFIADCDGLTRTSLPTPQSPHAEGTCIPSFTTGTKEGLVKDRPGGRLLCEFRLGVVE